MILLYSSARRRIHSDTVGIRESKSADSGLLFFFLVGWRSALPAPTSADLHRVLVARVCLSQSMTRKCDPKREMQYYADGTR